MIPISDKYKRLTQDSFRLKCSARITVQGYDDENNPIIFHFEPEQILSFDYHIWEDPVGRELPGIELKWTEFYTGRIDEDSITEKYKAALPLMRVDATISQDMVNSSAATFPLQSLFLVGTPEVNGHTITWTARDLLSFLNDNICRCFDAEVIAEELDYFDYNPVVYALLQERRNMSKYSLNYLLTFAYNIYAHSPMSGKSQYEFFNDQTKNCLMNYFSARGKYLSYRYTYIDDSEAGVTIEPDYGDYHYTPSSLHLFNFADVTTPSNNIIDCPIRLMKDYPKVTNGTNISAYNYTEHDFRFTNTYKYVKEFPWYRANITTPSGISSPTIEISTDTYAVRHMILARGYTISFQNKMADITPKIPHCIAFDPSHIVYSLDRFSEQTILNDNLYIFNYTSTEKTVNLSQDGETFTEDNPMLWWSQNSFDRLDNLTAWFNEENRAIEFTQLPNLSIEVGDTISVETNLYKDNKPIKYLAYVLDVQLSFNGGLWQKIICHTIGKDERENNNE